MSFQQLVQLWMQKCFGLEISADKIERNHRFFEEATELVQSTGMTASEAHQLVDYVYSRPVGDPPQEVGGTMVTLAALCSANSIDLDAVADVELTRINSNEVMQKIRTKQAAKPKHSPLPETSTVIPPWRNDIMDLAQKAGVAPNTIFHFEAAFLRFAELLTAKILQDATSEFNRAINFGITQGLFCGDFLTAWREGNTDEWPEFETEQSAHKALLHAITNLKETP